MLREPEECRNSHGCIHVDFFDGWIKNKQDQNTKKGGQKVSEE